MQEDNLIEIYQDYIDEEGYVQRYNYDKGRYYNTGTCLRGPKGNCGNPGRPGKDGLTPRINQDNGHWMIGDVDTGVMAVGGQSDWNQNDNTKLDYIKNKPTISSGSVILNDSYGAFDLSVHNAVNGVPTTYANLSAALTALNALDSTYKKPGMSFRFVRSSDNKYVQARCMAQNFTTDVTQWQGVDDEPTAGSENLVKSGGVDSQINGIDNFHQSNYLDGNINLSTGKWSNVGSYYHFACIVFQINDGGTLNVTANNTAAAQFAVLNTFTPTEIQNNATADIRISEEIQAGTTKYYQVNAGEYLYFYMGFAPAYSRTPQSVLLNGEDIIVMGGLSKRIDSLEDVVDTISTSVDSKLDKEFTGKNIFDKTNIEEGYYFGSDGTKNPTSYPLFVTAQPMPVKPDTDYFINVSTATIFMCWLDADKQFISSQKYDNTYYRSPAMAAFLAFSGRISDLDIIQIEEGTEGTSYEPYIKIDAEEDIPKIYNKVFEDFLNPKLYATLASASSGDSLTILNTPDVVNRYSIGFNCIVDELGEIIISKGERPYNIGKIIINDTNIVEYKPDNTTITTAHGLTISSVLAVNIYPYKSIVFANNIKALSALLVVTTNSGKFSKEIFWQGRWGDVNVSFTSGTYTSAVLSFGGDWVNQGVWIFADSYGDMWLPYTFEREYKNRIVLSNHSGGGSEDELLVLKNMLKYAKPKKILWTLGMNESDSSSAGTVNANWKSSLDELIVICNDNDIDLHLYTVPNVPSRLHLYKNEVVRNSGFPYLDAAKFFGAEEAGSTWYQGLLSPDNVHPSVIGREYFTTLIASYIPEIVS